MDNNSPDSPEHERRQGGGDRRVNRFDRRSVPRVGDTGDRRNGDFDRRANPSDREDSQGIKS